MILSEGIIVKVAKFQESSKIITILNEYEMSNYYVKSGYNYKSHNFHYSNELTKIAYDFSAKNKDSLKILKSGKVLNNYTSIKTDFQKLKDCLLIIEAIYLLGNHINDFKILYNFLNDTLDIIDDRPYSPYYLIIFKLKLLYLLGIGPIFTKCTSCDSKENLKGFVFADGGMICSNCERGYKKYLSNNLVSVLKLLYLTKLENITDSFLIQIPNYQTEIFEFLDLYYEHFLGYKSIANKIIEELT